jgi:hypothetical protein
MKNLYISEFCLIIGMTLAGSISADSVKINKTGTVFENVKTKTEAGVVTVDFEDGNTKKFRTRDVTVTPGEVVWLAEVKEEPNFLDRWLQSMFGSDESETDTATTGKDPGTRPGATASAGTSEGSKEEESAPIPYLSEGIFGGVAFLFLILP